MPSFSHIICVYYITLAANNSFKWLAQITFIIIVVVSHINLHIYFVKKVFNKTEPLRRWYECNERKHENINKNKLLTICTLYRHLKKNKIYRNKSQPNILRMDEKPNNPNKKKALILIENHKLTYRWPGLLQSDDAALLESSSSSLDVTPEPVCGSPGDSPASDGLRPTIDVVAMAVEASCASAGSICIQRICEYMWKCKKCREKERDREIISINKSHVW